MLYCTSLKLYTPSEFIDTQVCIVLLFQTVFLHTISIGECKGHLLMNRTLLKETHNKPYA